MKKLTKTETKVLELVRSFNDKGVLGGLGVNPEFLDTLNDRTCTRETRAIIKLYKSGQVVYLEHTPKLGAGWAIPFHDVIRTALIGGSK